MKFFGTIIAAVKSAPTLLKDLYNFAAHPTTKEQIYQNQLLRADATTSLKSEMSPSAADLEAVSEFWANQTYFIAKFLLDHKQELNEHFPFELSKDDEGRETISFATLNELLPQMISALEGKNHPGSQQLIKLFSEDCKAELPYPIATKGTPPTLTITAANSIQFAREQALAQKRVYILDAANGQRPGARGYEKGTFQEALSAETDSYLKFMVDFRNVLSDLKNNTKDKLAADIDDKDLNIDVDDYQRRFLKLIFYFVQQIMQNKDYLTSNNFRRDFFTYANGIYFDLQNKVMEMRPNENETGFVKNCRLTSLKGVKTTAELFTESNNKLLKSEILHQTQAHVLIMEDAAPDKRPLEGKWDRGCTFNATISHSDDDEIARQMLRDSIQHTIREAIQRHVDIVVLNAFGCGAFLNDPKVVAEIFADALAQHVEELKGKSIYFMDLNANMCKQFGAILTNKLQHKFNIATPEVADNIQFEIMQQPIAGNPKENEFHIITYNPSTFKLSGMHAKLGYGPETSRAIFVSLEDKPKTKEILQTIYKKAINNALNKNAETIRLPLLGTGNLGYSIEDSMAALLEALQLIQPSQPIKIFLQIPDKEKYSAAMDYFQYIAPKASITHSAVVADQQCKPSL